NPRKKVLIPDSTHGTNPATAVIAGYEVENIKSESHGQIDVDKLRDLVTGDVAALMITNPSTLGIFEQRIPEIAQILHAKGALLRGLAYIRAYGPGVRQATEDAVLNANYIRKQLEGVFELPYSLPSMHEVVFSDAIQKNNGVSTMDIAKRLIDYGFHPYTTAFPLIVAGAMMIEPTESESKEECDLFID